MAVTHLRRTDSAGMPDDFPLPKNRYGFGVSWDAAPGFVKKIDIDLQCVVIDNAGAIIDCAYYNNLKAVRAITHSGDEPTGAAEGIDEMVWVTLPRLPPNVALLVFVVACYSGGSLQDVVNGTLHVLEESKQNVIARFALERSRFSVDVVAAMFREPSTSAWTLRIIDEPAQQGQHFMDILPLISDVVRTFIPSAPKRQKVAFAMEKGSIVDLPQTLDSIIVGLGWDTGAGDVDLDVSAVLLESSGAELETVFFGNLESAHGVTHSGDNLTGEGDGDDEEITAQLATIGPRVQQIVFVINIFTPQKTFAHVANPYCRVVDVASGAELCRYSLSDAGAESGLIVSKLCREAGTRWGFHALGLPARGRTYKDSLPQIRQVFHEDTRKLMVRRGSTHDNVATGSAPSAFAAAAGPAHAAQAFAAPQASAPPVAGARPPVYAAPPRGSGQPKKDCTVQ